MANTDVVKPRPDARIEEERKKLVDAMNEGEPETYIDRYLEIMNEYDWSTELFSENGKYGIKKWDGTLLLPAAFDNFRMVTSLDQNLGNRVVAMLGDKEGVAVMDGENWRWMLEPEFDHVSYPNSIVAVKKGDKWGILDLSKREYLVPLNCDTVHLNSGFLCCNGIGIFEKDGRYGVISDSGECSKVLFDEVAGEPEGCVRVRIGDRWGYVNKEGQFEEDEELAYFVWDMG